MNKQNHLSKRKVILVSGPEDRGGDANISLLFRDCEIILNSNILESKKYYLANRVDIAIINNIPQTSCLKLLRFFKSIKPLVNVIIITASGSEEFAVTAFRNGASDYFSVPIDPKELETRIRCLLSSGEVKNRRRADYCPDNFRDTVNYISENYGIKIELSCMAHLAGMSVSCFQRAFKKKMGVTFTSYVNNLRISRAKNMLGNRNLSISEIAYSNGFSNQYHFSRTFKKITNISPRLYRNSLH